MCQIELLLTTCVSTWITNTDGNFFLFSFERGVQEGTISDFLREEEKVRTISDLLRKEEQVQEEEVRRNRRKRKGGSDGTREGTEDTTCHKLYKWKKRSVLFGRCHS
jgi:hypothetical protein